MAEEDAIGPEQRQAGGDRERIDDELRVDESSRIGATRQGAVVKRVERRGRGADQDDGQPRQVDTADETDERDGDGDGHRRPDTRDRQPRVDRDDVRLLEGGDSVAVAAGSSGDRGRRGAIVRHAAL